MRGSPTKSALHFLRLLTVIAASGAIAALVSGPSTAWLNSARAADGNSHSSPKATGVAAALPWHTFSGGAALGSASATRRLSSTIGQGGIGSASGAGQSAGLGFWYGAGVCDCSGIADQDGDGFPTATDLQMEVDIVFFGLDDIYDANCPYTRSDLNCDTFADATDLALIVDLVFFGGTLPCVPCE